MHIDTGPLISACLEELRGSVGVGVDMLPRFSSDRAPSNTPVASNRPLATTSWSGQASSVAGIVSGKLI